MSLVFDEWVGSSFADEAKFNFNFDKCRPLDS